MPIYTFLKLFTTTASAHVGYVVSQSDFSAKLGGDSSFFFSPLSDIKNLLLIFATLISVFVLYFLAWKIKKVRFWIIAFRARLDTYTEYIPWILRLSLGVAFMGASAANVLISPVNMHPGFAVIQMAIGFMLLAGFLVAPSALAGIAVYVYALVHKIYLFGNIEVLFALLALLVLGSARPGIDDLFGIPQFIHEKAAKYVPLLLRLGIGGSLVFLSFYEKILNPHVSELVVQKFGLNSIIPVGAAMWVFAVGIIELAVGLCIFIGFQTRLVSAIAFCVIATTFFFFKEQVYSHVTLFGILSILLITGSGSWSVDRLLRRSTTR